MSRSELHQRLALTPNGVGTIAEKLLHLGVLRECPPEPSTGGRPRVPLEIDPANRHVIGLSIARGRVEAVRMGLRGHVLGTTLAEEVSDASQVVPIARGLLKQLVDRRTLAISVSTPGFVDPVTHEILFSSATPRMGTVSLKELYDEAGNVPVLLENDMHAAGARWMLTHFASDQSDILLVGLDDGELGATMMIAGRSNRGCVTAANEIGHTRFFVDTERCYCGHLGCLERICSTDFLARRGVSDRLLDRVLRYDGDDPVLEEMVRFLAMGLANAVNFVRPNRLVLASRFTRFPKFSDLMVRSIRGLLLMELVDRVRIDLWDQPVASSAETAGWLALASLYIDSWTIRPV